MKNLKDSDLTKTSQACSVCGDSSEKRDSLKVQSAPDVFFKKCGHCGALTASRFPTLEYIKELYSPKHYKSSLVSSKSLSVQSAKRILKYLKFSSEFKILDYGGSNGELSLALINELKHLYPTAKVTSTVVDYYPQKSSDSLKFISVDEFFRSNEKYNVILASAVLEHIPHLKPVIDKLLQSATPSALFYARTPYDAPLSKLTKLYKVKWPNHVHDLGPEFWAKFKDVFQCKINILNSSPSIVETPWEQKPAKALISHILKFPGIIEAKLVNANKEKRFWNYVGGWEVYFEINPPSAN